MNPYDRDGFFPLELGHRRPLAIGGIDSGCFEDGDMNHAVTNTVAAE